VVEPRGSASGGSANGFAVELAAGAGAGVPCRAPARAGPVGHVAAVRALVFDPLTKVQRRHMRDIGRRIMRAIDPNDRCFEERP